MKAALVTAFGEPPRCAEIEPPLQFGEHDVLVDVVGAALHPRVRSQADGSHYTSSGELPLVPGVDGVGRGPDGALRYFVLDDTTHGSMAEQTVVDLRRSVVLPDGADAITVAAAMNPAMSSWVALRRRIEFEPGQSVLVLGATGNAGRMAVRVARLLGAARVVAAGRDAGRLAGLAADGADETVSLVGDPDEVAARLGRAAGDVDVVVDYVWGEATSAAIVALVTERRDRRRPLTWIEIGSVGGPTAQVPSAALRAARLQLVGSGQGSVATAEIVAELPSLVEHLASGALPIDTEAVALDDVELAWASPPTGARVVVVTGRR